MFITRKLESLTILSLALLLRVLVIRKEAAYWLFYNNYCLVFQYVLYSGDHSLPSISCLSGERNKIYMERQLQKRNTRHDAHVSSLGKYFLLLDY